MAGIRTTVTYLEMRHPSELRGYDDPDPGIVVQEVLACTVSFYRYLYGAVGEDFTWVDRTRWTDERLAGHLADPRIRLWVLLVDGCPAGYYELRRDEGGGVELAYFGLVREFHGRGLGKHLLTAAVRSAWAMEPAPDRVWLHTCTLDAPQALPNYLARGFTPYDERVETVGG
jgi:GNAT superfamily N-acetyltransferase